MDIIDPGHIYRVFQINNKGGTLLRFVKRSGGAIQYTEEWPGIQTQAVMRALIDYVGNADESLEDCERIYSLFQLGTKEPFSLEIRCMTHVRELLEVLEDRSLYLNRILECTETSDAIFWLKVAKVSLVLPSVPYDEIVENIRMALWSYEARAYRRKMEEVNRLHPAHDDTARMKAWRDTPADDIPFNAHEIELRPTGEDGHILTHTF